MAYDNFPAEIWEGILRFMPSSTLRSMMLVSWALHDQTKPYMYHTVNFDNLVESDRFHLTHDVDDFIVMDTCPHEPTCNSVSIRKLDRFFQVLDQNPALRQYVKSMSLSFINTHSAVTVKMLRCLRSLRLDKLHYRAPVNLGVLSSDHTVSIELVFSKGDYGLQRSQMYYVFNVPTLRHVCFRSARKWQTFSAPPFVPMTGFSNVTSITFLSTVPMHRDLIEILSWPKALLHYHHENKVIEGRFVVQAPHLSNPVASPLAVLEALEAQKTSLQSLYYNNEADDRGSADIFGTRLIEFSALKSLAVSQDCLIRGENTSMATTLSNTILPNSLEHLRLDQQGKMNNDDVSTYTRQLGFWLQHNFSRSFQHLPNLKKVVVWQKEPIHAGDNQNVEQRLQKLKQEL